MTSRVSVLDTTAIGLSSLCLVHCLALPVLGAFLPVAGIWAQAEWIHQVLVLMAVPITLSAVTPHRSAKVHLSFAIPALTGLSLLLIAGFIEAVDNYETWLTIIGALMLVAAHAWRWTHRLCSNT